MPKTPDQNKITLEQILDWLLDALREREAERTGECRGERFSVHAPTPTPTPSPAPGPTPTPTGAAAPVISTARVSTSTPGRREPGPGEEGWEPPPKQPPMHLERMLSRFLLLIAALVILVNVPVTRYGVSLARLMPDSAALIIRDGLVLKGSGPEIYILENNRLRWISSLDAFEHLGLVWGDVHIVEDSFLEQFEKGRPIYVLLKCPDSPHIYRLENGQKRWIKDIETFVAEGHVWEDVRMVSCEYLRSIPNGPPIPEDAGTPPE